MQCRSDRGTWDLLRTAEQLDLVTGGLEPAMRLTGGLEHCLAGHLVTGGPGLCCSIDVTGGLGLD